MSEREILISSIALGGVDRRDHPDYVVVPLAVVYCINFVWFPTGGG